VHAVALGVEVEARKLLAAREQLARFLGGQLARAGAPGKRKETRTRVGDSDTVAMNPHRAKNWRFQAVSNKEKTSVEALTWRPPRHWNRRD